MFVGGMFVGGEESNESTNKEDSVRERREKQGCVMEQFVVWKVLFKKPRRHLTRQSVRQSSDLGVDLIFALTKCYLVPNRGSWNLEVQARGRPRRYRGLAFD